MVFIEARVAPPASLFRNPFRESVMDQLVLCALMLLVLSDVRSPCPGANHWLRVSISLLLATILVETL